MDNVTSLRLLLQGSAGGAIAAGETIGGFLASPEVQGSQGALSLFCIAGLVVGLHDKFPNDEAWLSENGLRLLPIADQDAGKVDDTEAYNDFFLGRWAAIADVTALAELVRRAKNRDGSSAAIGTSTAAAELLTLGFRQQDRALNAALKAVGFRFPIIFGSFPRPVTVPAAVAAGGGGDEPPIVAHPPAAPAPVAAPPASEPPRATPRPVVAPVAAPRPAPAANRAVSLTVDETFGRVVVLGSKLPIHTAIALGRSLERAVRSLVIPAEGYVWVDDSADPLSGSALVCLDTVEGEGLPEFEGPGGGLLQAAVTQLRPSARYTSLLQNKTGGTQTFGDWVELNDAKFHVAQRVKTAIAEEKAPKAPA